jgi:hypothetical protein
MAVLNHIAREVLHSPDPATFALGEQANEAEYLPYMVDQSLNRQGG